MRVGVVLHFSRHRRRSLCLSVGPTSGIGPRGAGGEWSQHSKGAGKRGGKRRWQVEVRAGQFSTAGIAEVKGGGVWSGSGVVKK